MAARALAPGWYFPKREIEENSPSRQDGIDANMEADKRKSFSSFQQQLGYRLRLSQKTIATAIVFCHRFFLRPSLARNNSELIGTACLFLASKVEEKPCPLEDVVTISHEIVHKIIIVSVDDRNTVIVREKDKVLIAERVVVETINFDFIVDLPYVTLDKAVAKMLVYNRHDLGQCARNFVNYGLKTSICVQFRPSQIAAGFILLAARFLMVEVEVGPPNWWLWPEFGNVTMQQMNEICNQILEIYEIEQGPIPRPPNDV